jgi:hypothetical protein
LEKIFCALFCIFPIQAIGHWIYVAACTRLDNCIPPISQSLNTAGMLEEKATSVASEAFQKLHRVTKFIRQHFVEKLISVCTSPITTNCSGYVAILNKRTTSSHQRSIRPDHTRQISSKHSSDIAISAPSHASFIRISRPCNGITATSDSGYTQGKGKEVHRNLMQDIRIIPKRPYFLPVLAQGFLVDVHLLSAKYVCAREVRATV